MPELRSGAGLLDTSVVIGVASTAYLPSEISIAAITLAELASGPHATDDPVERGLRQERLQVIESTFDPLPFDVSCARAYGRVYTLMASSGRKPRGRRAVDLLIAATAVANDLPLYTLDADDVYGIESLLTIVDCSSG